MKKFLGTTAAIFLAVVVHAQVTVKGTVQNSDNAPLQGATITFINNGKQLSTTSDATGIFTFSDIPENTIAVVKATYINKQTALQNITIGNEDIALNFTLQDVAYHLEPLEVRSTRASDKAPFTKTNLTEAAIKKNNIGQDLPFILNQTPSVVVNADAGNGVGYTGIRIRGTDGTRINVTLNGIPYNDAESGGSYFVDLPDFASSVGSVQVQRGVGTSTNGAGAFGATINLSTNELHDSAYAEANNSFGSFNTWKNTIRVGSGLLNDHFTIDARLSRISSDGFIDRAKSNLQSLYFSAAYIDKKTSLRFNIFTGKEKTYQAWNGVPQAKLFGTKQDLENYYYNNIGTYYFTPEDSINLFNSNKRSYNLYTYPNQTDNYQQDHYQLFFNQSLNDYLSLNVASFLSRGRGYYEEYKYGQSYADYGLNNYVVGNDTISVTDLVRQRWLDNYFYGQTFSLQYKKPTDEITFGGSWTKYDGKHYGNVIWANAGIPKDYQYYNMPAYKTDVNVYAKWLHTFTNALSVFGDMQYRHVMHDMRGFESNPSLFIKRTFNFINPKAGISYTKHGWNAYISYALANKEPNRDDFEAGETDQPKHETLNDFEAGISNQKKNYNWSATLYYMQYKNQLVLTGQINNVGAYTRTNVPNSYRAGIELQAGLKAASWLNISGGATFSRNKIKSFTEYLDDYDGNFDWKGQQTIIHYNTDIAFAPNVVANGSIAIFPVKNVEIDLLSKYVSKQYLDNTQSDAKSLHSYFTEDVRAIYTFKNVLFKEWSIAGQLNNIFNKQYEANGYTFGYYYDNHLVTENYYFPMAGTYGTVSVNISL
ncbi:TonB-dependent receptor [Ilyomonas limi]|uniref:TonB-dependent receptor n=1 Tax=Ilyomonas limi TaxID=2575867 RepID=A0A4U3KXV9_9BACT|nr:TonB-dependent receptor [Ilyomonas limi]TKK66689.1 TonB-dependent receptor [Ilyomonas limi]